VTIHSASAVLFSIFQSICLWCFRDLDFILTLDVDWVALSFVQKPEDIVELKQLVGDRLRVGEIGGGEGLARPTV